MNKKARREGAMTPTTRILVPVVLAMLAGDAAAAEDLSANFPNRPIRMIVPFPAGGPSDIVARLIGQKMSEDWGQPVVVENRPGGNTIIGAQAAAKAAPDGYTLFMAIDSTLVMNQYLYKALPYDPLGDFVPITLTAKTVSVLAVAAAAGPITVTDLTPERRRNRASSIMAPAPLRRS
jgi:tripartite-type tricarboxylate transporter receptor subunit TctC